MIDRRSLRHPAEFPLLIAGVVGVIGAIPALPYILDAVGAWWSAVLLAAVPGVYIGRALANAHERANSVLITQEQFPEVHSLIVRISQEFGLKRVPAAYMAQEGGILNAFATKHHRTSFIRVNADIFEVGSFALGPRPKDPAVLEFVIAHEIGHIAASHVTYWYGFMSVFVSYIPFLGSALSRAKEYTADNYGYAAAPEGARGVMLLAGGKYLYRDVDPAQFVHRARSDRGVFLWMVNALSTHPILTKRTAALVDRSRRGRLF